MDVYGRIGLILKLIIATTSAPPPPTTTSIEEIINSKGSRLGLSRKQGGRKGRKQDCFRMYSNCCLTFPACVSITSRSFVWGRTHRHTHRAAVSAAFLLHWAMMISLTTPLELVCCHCIMITTGRMCVSQAAHWNVIQLSRAKCIGQEDGNHISVFGGGRMPFHPHGSSDTNVNMLETTQQREGNR